MNDPEIKDLVSVILSSTASLYVKKEAVRKIGRAKKSAELSYALVKLLSDLKDESLQREVMDLTADLVIHEAVNVLAPISTGNGRNARYAINIIAKIGGKQAYNALKELASKDGFDLTSNAASRALHDMIRRDPQLEDAATEGKVTTEVASDLVEGAPFAEKINMSPTPVEGNVRELHETIKSLKNQLKEKEARLAGNKQLEEASDFKKKLREAHEENQKLKNDLARQTALYTQKFSEMSMEISDLNDKIDAAKKSLLKPVQATVSSAIGCFGFIFAAVVFGLIILSIFK
jgi:hypothetical protein